MERWLRHQRRDRRPIDLIEQCRNIVRASVLIVQVIGVLPNIDSQEWASLSGAGDNARHKGVVLIGRGGHNQLVRLLGVLDKPGPTGPKLASSGGNQGAF